MGFEKVEKDTRCFLDTVVSCINVQVLTKLINLTYRRASKGGCESGLGLFVKCAVNVCSSTFGCQFTMKKGSFICRGIA